MRINSLRSSNVMRILSFFSSCILLFSFLISSNWEESIGTMLSQFFLFFNLFFSTFLPMCLSNVSPEFISLFSSPRFIELAKVWKDCVASCLVWTFKLSLRFNQLALYLKFLQQCSN
ncbi:hypothetical protein ACJW30_05G002700 [Castanea mollissima]